VLRASTLGVLAAALLAAGCGSEPQEPPDVGTPGPPGALTELEFDEEGVRLQVPSAWKLQRGPEEGPLLATLTSGRATIAVWRYPRTEPLPRTTKDLEATKDSLIAAVTTRDPEYAVTASRILRGQTRRGVELIGTGTNSGFERRARSLHLFGGGAEVVLDQYATAEEFPSLDADVFRVVAQSLRVDASTS
jgi:hypothetical protein